MSVASTDDQKHEEGQVLGHDDATDDVPDATDYGQMHEKDPGMLYGT
jgi:hypothetical protein